MTTAQEDRQDNWGDNPPWEQPGGLRRDCQPHRGGFLLVAAAGCLAFAVSVCLLRPALPDRIARTLSRPLDLISGLVALPPCALTGLSARRDLARMRKGLMDPQGEDATRSAHALCWLAAVFLVPLYLRGLGL